jgi:hexokinase
VDVVALVNDTTGTQLAVGIRDPECHIGLILGTGTNACYMENLDAVPKFTGDRSRYSQVIINTEWGAFGDDGQLDSFMTDFDRELDRLVVNKGQQT